ncbi:hypothetical protein CC78DRAFT_567359 [Lojkania enalia]|uniref:F-box domain-containing protein n=1 Tax=Lojkania enalia TaxID=147567 RepID=A0A9P4KDE6_9PLEO|nr:hypothetical protein CC78DRAFT_567359 [Didymosphaeria enalia]
MVRLWSPRTGQRDARLTLSSTASKVPPAKTDSKVTVSLTRTSIHPPVQHAPILSLPLELVQHITTFLDPFSVASFCLSTRYIYYAVGTRHLSAFLSTGYTKFSKRKNFEVLERAFPSHWYCAWCDKFHLHDREGGPKNFDKEEGRDCAEFNSYMHAGKELVVCYHHVRLALNRYKWGPDYGIPLEDFNYHADLTTKIFTRKTPATLDVEARIMSGHLILHATFIVAIDRKGGDLPKINEKGHFVIPQIVFGHKDSRDGHMGLKYHIWKALDQGYIPKTQGCSTCATDYLVTPTHISDHKHYTHSTPKIEIRIETWRDLGDGRNPFQASWRAHGEIGNSEPGNGRDMIRLTSLRAGQIREAFEKGLELQWVPGSSEFTALAGSCVEARPRSWDEALKRNWTRDIVSARTTTSSKSELTEVPRGRERNWYEDEMHRLELERLGKESSGVLVARRQVGHGYFGG